MTMFATDQQRRLAIQVNSLIARLEAAHGEDRGLGADIVETIGAPTTIGDPTSSIDCVLHLAEHLKQSSTRLLWKVQQIKPEPQPSHLARIMCARVLIIHLATLMKAPA